MTKHQTTYRVTHPSGAYDLVSSGTLEEAAEAVLTYDGADYEIRDEATGFCASDGRGSGRWRLWSCTPTTGYVETNLTIDAPTEEEAKQALYALVVRQQWRGHPHAVAEVVPAYDSVIA